MRRLDIAGRARHKNMEPQMNAAERKYAPPNDPGNRIWDLHHPEFAARPDSEPPRRQDERQASGGEFEPSKPWPLGGSIDRQIRIRRLPVCTKRISNR
jgi:hypothetical protein